MAQEYRIFLSYAKEDQLVVKTLYHRLCSDGFNPWFDEVDLVPGQDWHLEIKRSIRNSLVVLICLSNKSVMKRGFVQKEIRDALAVADEQPEGPIFIIPVRLERCTVPDSLGNFQWVDLFDVNGYEKLRKALQFHVFQTVGGTFDLKQYIDELLDSRGFVGLNSAIRDEIARDLYTRLDDFLAAHIIATLSDRDVQVFEQMIKNGRSWSDLQEFAATHIPDFMHFFTQTLIQFRLVYLNPSQY